jgi:carbamoyl-phosphate synthase large subunit
MLRTSNGKGFGGMVVRDPQLDAITQSLIAELRWNGPFELEFVKPDGPRGILPHRDQSALPRLV